MWPSVRQSFGQFKVGTEGKFKYMYCDVNGYVTTAVGNLLKNADEAKKLNWHVKDTAKAASPDQVEEGFNAVRQRYQDLKLKGERLTDASKYRHTTPLRLTEAELMRIVFNKLDRFDVAWKSAIGSEWETFPADAQLAILGISWKMGVPLKVKQEKRALYDAIAKRDFAKAAKESSFSGSSARRRWKNQAIEWMFVNAGTVDSVQKVLSRLNKPAQNIDALVQGDPFAAAFLAAGVAQSAVTRGAIGIFAGMLAGLIPSQVIWPKKVFLSDSGKLQIDIMPVHPPGEEREF
jgi:hypothetical protein